MEPINSSQIKEFSCPRRWVTHLSGFKEPDSVMPEDPSEPIPADLYGKEFHKIADQWIRTGETPYTDMGLLFEEGIPHFRPGIRDGATPEEEVFFEVQGIQFKATLDVRSGAGNEVFVDDWKTSANPKAYGLDRLSVLTDSQALMYPAAASLFVRTGTIGLRKIHFTWHYWRRPIPSLKGKYVYSLELTFSECEVWKRFGFFILPTARAMVALHGALPPPEHRSLPVLNSIPHNPDACDTVGQFCGFAGYCKMWNGIYTSDRTEMLNTDMLNSVIKSIRDTEGPDVNVLEKLKSYGMTPDKLPPETLAALLTGNDVAAPAVTTPAAETPAVETPAVVTKEPAKAGKAGKAGKAEDKPKVPEISPSPVAIPALDAQGASDLERSWMQLGNAILKLKAAGLTVSVQVS